MPATGLNRYVPDWSVTSNPGVGVQASASRPASPAPPLADSKHVCTSISATLVAAAATAAQATLNLRDGATGAGTILGSWVLAIPATIGACIVLSLDSLEIIGSPNTAMTLEFSAGVATQFESVTMTGHTL
jgi:hypothetical protein